MAFHEVLKSLQHVSKFQLTHSNVRVTKTRVECSYTVAYMQGLAMFVAIKVRLM